MYLYVWVHMYDVCIYWYYVCVCVHAFVWGCTCMMCVHVEASVSLKSVIFFSFFFQDLSLNLEPINTATLVAQLSPGLFLSPPPGTRITGSLLHLAFVWVLGF